MKIFQPKFFMMSHEKISQDESKGRPHGYTIIYSAKYEMNLGGSCSEKVSKFRFA